MKVSYCKAPETTQLRKTPPQGKPSVFVRAFRLNTNILMPDGIYNKDVPLQIQCNPGKGAWAYDLIIPNTKNIKANGDT